ncbi:MAG: hypothetical protein A3E85_02490 [Gammaproteobacteria bacterium RIFCSPHIGHO2_12_FULL_45_12]|nr:MAG: hypothetical protein A3E85_02490 [Gammaproteobacteria bacterium RIFCSPHIGHO2_12_FULL_45_12]
MFISILQKLDAGNATFSEMEQKWLFKQIPAFLVHINLPYSALWLLEILKMKPSLLLKNNDELNINNFLRAQKVFGYYLLWYILHEVDVITDPSYKKIYNFILNYLKENDKENFRFELLGICDSVTEDKFIKSVPSLEILKSIFPPERIEISKSDLYIELLINKNFKLAKELEVNNIDTVWLIRILEAIISIVEEEELESLKYLYDLIPISILKDLRMKNRTEKDITSLLNKIMTAKEKCRDYRNLNPSEINEILLRTPINQLPSELHCFSFLIKKGFYSKKSDNITISHKSDRLFNSQQKSTVNPETYIPKSDDIYYALMKLPKTYLSNIGTDYYSLLALMQSFYLQSMPLEMFIEKDSSRLNSIDFLAFWNNDLVRLTGEQIYQIHLSQNNNIRFTTDQIIFLSEQGVEFTNEHIMKFNFAMKSGHFFTEKQIIDLWTDKVAFTGSNIIDIILGLHNKRKLSTEPSCFDEEGQLNPLVALARLKKLKFTGKEVESLLKSGFVREARELLAQLDDSKESDSIKTVFNNSVKCSESFSLSPNEYVFYSFAEKPKDNFDQTVYQKLLCVTAIACQIENTWGHVKWARQLTVLFNSFEKAMQYLEIYKKNNPHSAAPIHDACQFDLPNYGIWDVKSWSDIVLKHPKLMKILPSAARIEQELNYHPIHTRRLIHERKYAQESNFIKRTSIKEALIRDIYHTSLNRKKVELSQSNEMSKKAVKKAAKKIVTIESARNELISRDITLISYSQLLEKAAQIGYKRHKENPLLAHLCIEQFVSESIFNDILTIMHETQPEASDVLPNIRIEGKELRQDNLYLVKLDKNDPRGWILGHYTGCCQSIGRHAEQAVIEGMLSPIACFYVICDTKTNDIVAQSYAWLSEEGNLVFDSLETLRRKDAPRLVEFFIAAAYQMKGQLVQIDGKNKTIERIHLGKGGGTPSRHLTMQLDSAKNPLLPASGYRYGDANEQWILVSPDCNAFNIEAYCKRFPHHNAVSVKKDDLAITYGIDTYVNPGQMKKTLSVKSRTRQLFFNTHQLVQRTLRESPNNPLLEEGNIDAANKTREHEGEYYITISLLKRLIDIQIRQKSEIENSHYNANNLFCININDDKNAFSKQLFELNLASGEDAKFIIVNHCHATTCYVRNVDGKIKVLLVDSEPSNNAYDDSYLKTILRALPFSKIFITSTQLQRDYSSCSTFAIKSLMYFSKHGNEIFPLVDKRENFKSEHDSIAILKPEKTPPKLLKMCQTRLELDATTLDTSVNKKNTLKEYYQKHQKAGFNTAALFKTYQYFHLCEKSLVEELRRENP